MIQRDMPEVAPVPLFRFYRSGDHVFTISTTEANILRLHGWTEEGHNILVYPELEGT